MTRRHLLRLAALSPVLAAARAAGLVPLETALAQSAAPDVELELTAAPGSAQLLPGQPTRLWRYNARVVKGPANAV